MAIVHTVEKFGPDESLEREWEFPDDVISRLAPFVHVYEGWIVDVWPMTEQIAALVQPFVTEPIDVTSGAWFVTSSKDPTR